MTGNAIRVASMLLVAVMPFAVYAQGGTPRSLPDPLWLRVLAIVTSGGLLVAFVTGFFKWKELHQQLERIDHETAEKLKADLTKLEVEMEARLKAEARTQVARLRESYVNALPFHATLLRDHMSGVGEKLADAEAKRQMATWFRDIKNYGSRHLFRNYDQNQGVISPMEFSAWLHYPLIFAMSTLYYTSVFFLFSQRIRTLAPFSEADSEFSDGLDEHLKAVGDAFARRKVTVDARRETEHNGLWETVQNNMGAIVRKEDWYISYPEFCRIFVDIEQPRRDDHIFLRALDFFGAGQDGPLLTTEAAKSIVDALDSLLSFLREQRVKREHAERNRRWQPA